MLNALIAFGALYLSAVGVLAALLAVCVGIEYWGRLATWWRRRRLRVLPTLRDLPVLHDARDADLARDTEAKRRALKKAVGAPHHRHARNARAQLRLEQYAAKHTRRISL
jgi:hypothetical protein